jgi:sulfonate transport system permease protein
MVRVMPASRERLWTLIAVLGIWELLGQFRLVARGALPAPSAILVQFWADRADYPPHILATLGTAFLGFVIGNLIAISLGLLFVFWRPAERLMAGVNVTIFAMPSIALTPILIIALEGNTPRIVLAALSVYYPTMVATVLGLTQVDSRLTDVVRAYGGRTWATLRWVRLRSSLPTLLSGLRVAAPAAVLGSLLAEFGGGGRAGLGTYLIGSLGRGDPARLWGIGLTATAISGLAYWFVDVIARRVAGNTISASTPIGRLEKIRARPHFTDLLMPVLAVLMPFIFWWLGVVALEARGISSIVLRTPLQLAQDLFLAENAAQVWTRLLAALASTVPYCLLGMIAGLGFALAFAIVSTLWKALGQVLLPFALVSQSMPLVALTPLIVLIFGRDAFAIIVITISVTFFPAFVTIAQGLELVPPSLLDYVRGTGGNPFMRLRLISLPWSLPYLCAAARLAAPRAFLGVMIAEWLATGTGIGDLLNQARGSLEYGMIWNVAVISVLIAVALHQLAAILECLVLRRYAMTTD